MAVGLLALAEIIVFALVASWIGIGWTILAALATSALGGLLLARQGVRALGELRERARARRPAGRELGDAGLVAVGGLLMVMPGFVGDLIGLLCLLPGTRPLIRAGLARLALSRVPDHLRGPVRVDSSRTAPVDSPGPSGGYGRVEVIEGEVVTEVVRDTPGQRPPLA
ncbi:FxsA family protein [Blastococcus jejuensis]